MSNLIIDEGNTLCKAAIADNGVIVSQTAGADVDAALSQLLTSHHNINNIISISTRREKVELPDDLKAIPHTRLDATTKLPIKIDYSTPQTLGRDRVAAAVGAQVLFPASNVLIIDVGTAITIDFLDKTGIYHGGVISPGPEMRAKALNTFTGRLPLVEVPDKAEMAGKDTTTAIQYGIFNGIVYEIDGYINRYRKEIQDIKAIITGGFGKLFKHSDALYEPHLVLIGMNRILENLSCSLS